MAGYYFSYERIFCIILDIIEVCHADWYLPGTSGMFTSMDNDNNGLYDNNLDCTWIIEAEVWQSVNLHILNMDIQEDELCSHDYLIVSRPVDKLSVLSLLR